MPGVAPEPRRTIRPSNGTPASADASSGESAVVRLEKAQSRPWRTHDVAVEVVGRPEREKQGEELWTAERKSVSWRWSVIIAGGMLGMVILALVIVQMLSVVRRGDGVCRIGITSFAQDELGEVVFVELPEVGQSFAAGDEIGTIESVKAVAEIYSPLAGEVVAVNESLDAEPEKVNDDVYGEGWLIELRYSDAGELESLMKAEEYEKAVSGG